MRHRLAAHALAQALGFSVLISRLSLQAQFAPTTTLSGTVLHPTGAVVPNAAVERTNTGTYDLTIAAPGFGAYRQSGITLDVNVPASLRVTLSIRAMTNIRAWRSGTPFTILSGQDRSFSGIGLDRADLTGNSYLVCGRSTNQYFNISAPRYFNVDLPVQKLFTLRERSRLQLREDFFNMFNNVHLNAPGANLNAPSTFGKIISAAEPRTVRLALRVEF